MSSGFFKTVGVVAGVVALAATGVGAFAAAGTALAGTAGSIATYAGLAATAANIGARVTAPKPVARGSVTQTVLAAESPRSCIIGETYAGGAIVHQTGYGATEKKVPNPNYLRVAVYSGVAPVEALVQPQFDFAAIGSYYNGFYDYDSQLGLKPEPSALVPPYGAAPGWDASSKLSGCAAIAWNLKFDKDGKVYASGAPVMGAIWKGVMVYDPRLDSTRPGGSGTHRADDETTWEYSTNPALHAGTYALGRYWNGIHYFGIGLDDDGIDWVAIADWANDCEANGWECHGVIYEGGSQSGASAKDANMTDIAAAGGGRWFMSGAVLSFDWHRPRVSLATFTDKDIKGEGANLIPLQSHRDRFNTVRPRYIVPTHNWEMKTAEKIANATYITEDGGREKAQTWPLNLVKDDTQAGQLATYAMADSREIGPVTVPLGLGWEFFRAGEVLTWQSDFLNETRNYVVIGRSIDPASYITTFTLKSETSAKHAYALGEAAVPPPTPVIGQTGAERDAVSGYITEPRGAFTVKQFTPSGSIAPGDGEVVITAFDALIDDGRTLSFPADTITGLAQLTGYRLLWDIAADDYLVILGTGATERESSQYIDLGGFYTSDGTSYPAPTPPPPGYTPPSDPDYQVP